MGFGATTSRIYLETYRSLQMCVEDGNMPWRARFARDCAHI